MGSFRATGTFNGLVWVAIGGGKLCVGRGVNGGDEAGGTVEDALVGTGRTSDDETGADDVFWFEDAAGGCGFDTADTVTRVPTLPARGPAGVAGAVEGFVLVVLERDRKVFEAGIVGNTCAP